MLIINIYRYAQVTKWFRGNLQMISKGVKELGVSGTFRLFEIDQDGERKLIYLIDNHAPYGFHEHDELPDNHESRVTIHVKSWQEAWDKFQTKCKEITK